jgi:FkbM family methyltransferase
MQNVFLDLGTHYGQGLEQFHKRFHMDETWKIYTFEANPVTYDIYVKQHLNKIANVNAQNKAVSDHNGTITVNLETPLNEGDTGQGTSIISIEEWNPWGLADDGPDNTHFNRQVEVPCFDFSDFIRETFSKDDNLIIKMDIEGSEYDVLDKMIADGTIEYVNHISVEWHSRFFRNVEQTKKREAELLKKLNTYKGLVLESWR